MEVSMSLNPLIRLPLKSNSRTFDETAIGYTRHSIQSTRKSCTKTQKRLQFVVEAKSKGQKGTMERRFPPPLPPALPKFEDDGNPRFVLFIRMANVYLWYPLSIVTGGTTAKIMVAAKDNFMGKYIYKDTVARNLAAVVYENEKELIKNAKKQSRVLRTATEFKYGYKLVENGDVKAALAPQDVIELPDKDQLKTVVDKVFDLIGDAKESFGKLTTLNTTSSQEAEETSAEKSQ